MMMKESSAWLILFLAGLLEITWAIGLKYTEGFSKILPTILVLGLAAFSFALLAQAMKTIPVGTAYAVWTGIGAMGAATLGILFLQEPVSLPRVIFLLMIFLGIVGLYLFS
jgi:quaternary ammonium compound-resistance protein SugE